MDKSILCLMFCDILIVVCAVTQDDLNYIADHLDVKYEVVENVNGNDANFTAKITLRNTGENDIEKGDWEIYFTSLYMVEPNHIPKEGSYQIQGSTMMVAHVNGGLFKLFPADNFQTFSFSTSMELDLVLAAWSVARTDAMSRWYIAATDLKAVNIQSTNTESLKDFTGDFDSYKVWKRYDYDRFDPWNATDRGKRWTDGVTDDKSSMKMIIPTPANFQSRSGGFELPLENWKIIFNDETIKNEADFCKTSMEDKYSWSISVEESQISSEKSIFLNLDPEFMKTEIDSYQLDILPTNNHITIQSATSTGIYYGIQSLISLIDGSIQNNAMLSSVTISDKARYEYRGLHVDLARNYRPNQHLELLKLIKMMGMYKLNKLHLHLTDDEGWRIEMDWCPQLTSVGGKRCHDLKEAECIIPQFGSGATSPNGRTYLTKEEYKMILTEANNHHIEVIPEIDMPGHTHAAIKAVEAYAAETNDESFLLSNNEDPSEYISIQMFTDNAVEPCKDSTYRFVEKVVETMIDYHKDIQPLKKFHLGGDEVAETAWDQSPACKQVLGDDVKHLEIKDYFMSSASKKVHDVSKNLTLGLWEDGVMNSSIPFERNNFLNKEVLTYNWQSIWEWGYGNRPYVLANAGYQVVMCQATNLYFDHPYEPDPEERGLYWATRYTDVRRTFGFRPDDLYSNVETKRSGEPYSREQLCKDTDCIPLEKPENIVGIQGQIFAETMRTTEQFQYMLYPRLLALAERAWHKADWEESEATPGMENDFSSFVNTLGYKEIKRLEDLNIAYRISVPGIRITDDHVHVHAEFPGLPIQYSYTNSDEWTKYTEPLAIVDEMNNMKFRCTSYDGKRFSRETTFRSASSMTNSFNKFLMASLLIGFVKLSFV